LRLGVGVTFVWIGIMIVQEPLSWAGYMDPWVLNLIPGSVEFFMTVTGIIDIILGAFLVLNLFTNVVGYLVALHMVGILVGGGVNDVTVRDIAILAGGTAIGIDGKRYQGWPWW